MQIVVHLVGKMPIFFTLFTHMLEHISFFIWSLVLDTWSLEIGSHYSLIEEDGKMRVLTIRPLDFGDSVYLGQQIWQTYRGPTATHILALSQAYTSGCLVYRGATLTIDLHSLFSIEPQYLARAKKALMLALHYDLVSIVIFQVWGTPHTFTTDYFDCVLFNLFLTHIAPLLRGQQLHVQIEWDTIF